MTRPTNFHSQVEFILAEIGDMLRKLQQNEPGEEGKDPFLSSILGMVTDDLARVMGERMLATGAAPSFEELLQLAGCLEVNPASRSHGRTSAPVARLATSVIDTPATHTSDAQLAAAHYLWWLSELETTEDKYPGIGSLRCYRLQLALLNPLVKDRAEKFSRHSTWGPQFSRSF